MENLVRLVIVGQSGAGKSRLANTLKNPREPEEVRRTYECHHLHAHVDYNEQHYNLRIVDTPGFFQDGVTEAIKSWRDIVAAVYRSGMEVDVFVIVLKATEVEKSKEVIHNFVELLGKEAPLNSVIVFTHVNYNTTEREVLFCHGDYLQDYMKLGFPYVLWKEGDRQGSVNKLMKFVTETNKVPTYLEKYFSNNQMDYTKKWIRHQKTKMAVRNFSSLKNDEMLLRIGIPDVVIQQILSEKQKAALIQLMKE